MPMYEHVFLARQDLANAQVEAMSEAFIKIITDGNGRVAKNEYWGLRSIAYRIKKNRKAHYVMFNIDAPPAAIAELERQVGLSEDILRFMTVRVDAMEEGPSAMMRRNESREREGRDGGREGGREGRDGDRPRGDRPDRDRDRPRGGGFGERSGGGGFGGDRGAGGGAGGGGFRPRAA
ncbi:MAG: 30S ribosomal protein S6 [Sphingomonadaceae bacterium]|nr:30S ribosomal protein S6 [Sphingomonadaceae bacterium]